MIGNGIAAVVLAFLLPFASSLGIAGSMGILPRHLTAFSLVRLMSGGLSTLAGGSEDFMMLKVIVYVIFLIPLIGGMILTILNFRDEDRKTYIISVVISALIFLAAAGVAFVLLSSIEDVAVLGYSVNIWAIVLYLAFAAATLILSIMGLVKGGGAVQSGAKRGNNGKKVRIAKKDGRITGLRGSYAGAVIPVGENETIIIGRDPACSNIVINNEKASRKHCSISYDPGSRMYSVTDYSINGTFDGQGNKFSPKVAVMIPAGSEISIGKDGDVFILG